MLGPITFKASLWTARQNLETEKPRSLWKVSLRYQYRTKKATSCWEISAAVQDLIQPSYNLNHFTTLIMAILWAIHKISLLFVYAKDVLRNTSANRSNRIIPLKTSERAISRDTSLIEWRHLYLSFVIKIWIYLNMSLTDKPDSKTFHKFTVKTYNYGNSITTAFHSIFMILLNIFVLFIT